jgi:heat shock protein HtpX
MFSAILSLFLLGMAIATLPRFGKVPKKIINRGEFPALFKLLDSITMAANSKDVYGIVINQDFNAAYSEVGIRRRKIVYIGLPLFYVLNNKERVAVLSHEIAHGINGDTTRKLVARTALITLVTWYEVLLPGHSVNKSIINIIVNLTMSVLTKIVLLFIEILVHLVYSDSQRAEYWADLIGASISGTDAMKSLLDKLHLDSTYMTALQRAVLSSGKISLFDELLTRVNLVPEKELKRISIVERMEGSSLDATHPPTANRIILINNRESSTLR